jgi:hypothetical protein
MLERIRNFGRNLFESQQPFIAEDFNLMSNVEGACLEVPRSHGGQQAFL